MIDIWRKLLDWIFGRKKVVGIVPKRPRVKRPKVEHTKLCDITGKVRRTEKWAKQRAKLNTYPKLRAYKCQFCPSWHITRQRSKLTLH